MSYTQAQKEKILRWLQGAGRPQDTIEDVAFYSEFVPGQLLQAAMENISLMDWDAWQHLQNETNEEFTFQQAMAVVSLLWQNEIEILELSAYKE